MAGALAHYTGTASTPGLQILVRHLVTEGVARLWSDAVRTTEYANPFTTDGAGAYDFWAEPSIKIVELLAGSGGYPLALGHASL